MPKVPVVEIWRNEAKPYTHALADTHTTPPSPPTSPVTPTKSKLQAKPKSKTSPKSSISPTKSAGRGGRGATGKSWTPEEKLKLYDIVVKNGATAKHFEGQLEGRTGRQCYLTWHNTVSPAIRRSLGGEDK